MPLNGHLDGMSEGAGLKGALSTGKPKAALFPTSADQRSLTIKPEANIKQRAGRGRTAINYSPV